jgi:large subunit ribosomal protein L4
MKETVYNQKGEAVGQLDLPAGIFEVPVNKDLLHQAVTAQMANSRKVLAHTKDRSEKRGGGRKPWRQKGTGRARHGSIRSPIWRGGGVTFGPTKDRNFSKKINKKMKQKALLMALSSKASDQEIVLLDKIELKKKKTKLAFEVIEVLAKKLRKDLNSLLIVLPKTDLKINQSFKNIPKKKTVRADNLNVLDVLTYKNLLILQDSIKVIEKTYKATKYE